MRNPTRRTQCVAAALLLALAACSDSKEEADADVIPAATPGTIAPPAASATTDVDDDDGRVVLKGNVRTAEQKTQVEQIARRVAASVPVVSELRVQ